MSRAKTAIARIEVQPEGELFHTGVQCFVVSVAYDYRTRYGRLTVGPVSCTDMGGAIRLFQAIDSRVMVIDVYAGARLDIRYQRRGDDWQVAAMGRG